MSLLRRLFGSNATPPFTTSRADSGSGVQEDVICLAFSRKHGGRCVAGLKLREGGWIRPVSAAADGTLLAQHYRLRGNSEPRVLDVIRIPLDIPRPEPHQPENWVIASKPWSLVSRPGGSEAWPVISEAISRQPLLLGQPGDRVSYQMLVEHPASASLSLVAPADCRFVSTNSYGGNPQARVRFSYGGNAYNLAVTDPIWELSISGRPEGQYQAADLKLDERRLLFTISLGEPFEGNCYKLVAAIFESPFDLLGS